MNIAIFTHNYPRTSSDRVDAGNLIYDFAKILSRKHKIFILCPDFGGKKENYKDIKVTWIKYGSTKKFGNYSYFNPFDLVKLARLFVVGCLEAERLVKKNKIDYILSAWAIPSGIFALYTKIKLGTRYGVWYLGSDLNIYAKMPVMNLIMEFIARKADNLFANSRWLCGLATSLYKKPCTFTPTSTVINTKRIGNIKISKNKVNILFIARFENVKGPDILLEAIKIVSKKCSNFVLRMIGVGTMDAQLKKYVKDNGIDKYVEFLGDPGWYEKFPYVKASDFLVVASRNESLPLVMLEVANFNLPVISSDVGDSRYVVNKYKIGEIAKNKNAHDMARVISNFIANKKYKVYKRLGKFSDFVNDYSLKNSAELFLRTINND